MEIRLVEFPLLIIYPFAPLPSLHKSPGPSSQIHMVVITFPILLNLQFSIMPATIRNPPRFKFKTSEANWSEFALLAEEKTASLSNVDAHNLLSLYSLLIQALLDSASATIPRRGLSANRLSSPPWWNAECTLTCKKRKEAERTFSSNMTLENFYYTLNF